ncbi:MAG: chemotaxis response regulator protein-glutamate methylesterase [Candidatus Eisenbacteria bacterium]|uniref:Protein-glutamate methylesterase/protein-glutamine glutaminase n=1 Tax=Eiseniibacteriota bacterium TaxID=2212470 RepID=A0A956LXJ9_UNCEI|nr:chemotaxis response regulator protein-glutamate methylesterase [Candidatus Eisenbacteria bacterium]
MSIRILIVDDSVVVRRILSDVLTSDPDIELAGIAANGRIGLQKIPQVQPDIVTLDLEMPEMDGIATLREIRRLYPDLPVLLFSTLTERGAAATLDGLAAGASDYVTKPANVGSVQAAMQRIREEMIPKVKSLCAHKLGGGSAAPARPKPAAKAAPSRPVVPATPAPVSLRRTNPDLRPEILAIGSSTGGPNALAALLPSLPADFPVPIVIVQHMPALFTRLLAERLKDKGPLDVREAQEGEFLEAGKAWIAPGDFHLELRRRPDGRVVTHLQQGPPENSCRPAVDVLFRSVAAAYGRNVLAVVLTGMGQDGLLGGEAIRDAGGEIWAQDEESCVVWGMPGAVARGGVASRVLPLDQLAPEIARHMQKAAA